MRGSQEQAETQGAAKCPRLMVPVLSATAEPRAWAGQDTHPARAACESAGGHTEPGNGHWERGAPAGTAGVTLLHARATALQKRR